MPAASPVCSTARSRAAASSAASAASAISAVSSATGTTPKAATRRTAQAWSQAATPWWISGKSPSLRAQFPAAARAFMRTTTLFRRTTPVSTACLFTARPSPSPLSSMPRWRVCPRRPKASVFASWWKTASSRRSPFPTVQASTAASSPRSPAATAPTPSGTAPI